MDHISIKQSIIDNINRVIVGKERVVELLVAALIAEGHVIIEDVPGVGKTLLAKTLAKTFKLEFNRIQFTPDLIPSDVVGLYFYNQKLGEFQFRPGPVMANIVLADEINRATPRTQSSLLEAMAEGQVTIDGVTHVLPRSFMVIATQNPIEFEGTFPLPEAQLDRFLMRLRVGYPDYSEELKILERFDSHDPLADLQPVADGGTIEVLKNKCQNVYVCEEISRYIVDIVKATREHPRIRLGASPRASLALYKTSKAIALLRDRDYVIPDDVKYVVEPVLAHRIVLNERAYMEGEKIEDVLQEIVRSIPVPVEDEKSWGISG